MSRVLVAGLVFLAAAAAAGCTAGAPVAPARESVPIPVTKVLDVRDRSGAWTADPRWTDRVAAIEAAAAPAVTRLSAQTGLSFERGREPVLVFDESAPSPGDVALRFVDGLRRPVVRVAPGALLAGTFRADQDLAPLVVRGAVLAGAVEREPPAWVVAGVSIVVGDAFDRRLRERALGGADVRTREEDLFGPVASDPLAAAARTRAMMRTSRSERPLARFLTSLFDGRSEDDALADIGITRTEFLDAAADTERDRAARTISSDPVLPALVAARAALTRGETDRADAALSRAAESIEGPSADPWIVADARLCLARVALARGESGAAKAALDAAVSTPYVVRVREARLLGAALAAAPERPSALRALLADFPDAASDPAVSGLFAIPATVAAKHPETAKDLVSADVAKRRAAAARLGESGARDAAGPLRFLAGDADASVRRAAIAALAVALGSAADDDVERATSDADATVRRTALDLLAVSDRARATKRAAQMKDDADPEVRARAAELARPK